MLSQAHDIGVPSLLEALRTGTGSLHVALEKRLPFFSVRLDADWYRRLLEAYYGFYAPIEAALYGNGLIPNGFDCLLRAKTPTLIRDLNAFGLDDHAINALPRCTRLPTFDSPAACLGALYVLEGATLGGQVLRREMATRLALDSDNGASFLNVYGAETGRRWKEFLDYLGSLSLDMPAKQRAVMAARSTFSGFEQWLDSQEVLL
ncbi:biliverdin-producing heme oxygenase [Pseudomonas haemolytica]|uniref:Biliverdin-producing heme oxygenase n=1 Tax=Pseudomonas haemolytica TaxID=2600065 RepID=A0A5P1DGX6_9PSED|nr:biliverdin-producing heme oxygenase [Pseudomonas haemolytica]MBJ2248631.1 biliverdin-producing heme oxygenase [Pseudomonas haemolytica]MBJ2276068.1 biliverdin-producing heme oxygenase [Pseudomonas haemolytica]MBK3451114.1 biliverdin-producing heme oxygenase [Pseudomonas haemolytica]MBK3461937.1 biliverdin-producing heme oxygenase [Pseudomonas haemolytica]MRJ39734.1 biliverdin-producing heme oxygenase [Pseudomonas haemolytica]